MTHDFGTSGLSDALVILGAAGIVIPTFARFRISPVIGFILVGMLVGPAGFGAMTGELPWLNFVTISNPEAIEPFAEFGITLLLFSIGLELSFRRLWGMRRLVFGVGAAELLVSAAVIGIVLYATGETTGASIGLGLALALSSTAIVLPLVGSHSAVGRSALAMLLFEDLALVPIVFALGAMAPQTTGGGLGQLVQTMLVGGAVAVAMLFAGRLVLPRLFAQAARTKNPEMFLAACLLVVIVASLVTRSVGFSPILGALIAGIVIAETEYRGEVEVITAPFRGLGLGIFLITVGMSVDLQTIIGHWPEIIIALLAVLALKAIITGLLLRLGGAQASVAAETGVLMSSPSETTLIVLASAVSAKLIAPDAASFWQIVTAMGLTVTPLLARLGRLAGSRVGRRQLAGKIDEAMDSAATGQVMILGFGRVGRIVADMLETHGKDYVAIDADIDVTAQSRELGYDVVFGDVAHAELIESARRRDPAAFILTMDNPILVRRLTRQLRKVFPQLPIIARARDTAHAAQLYKAGASDAIPETLEASLQLSEAALVDLGVAMGPVIASIHEKRSELRAEIMEDADLEELPRLGRRRARDSQPVKGSNRSTPAK